MGNVARDVLRHGRNLREGAHELHTASGLQPGYVTTFEHDAEVWEVMERRLSAKRARLPREVLLRLGYAALDTIAGSSNLQSQGLDVSASGLAGVGGEVRMSVSHGFDHDHLRKSQPDRPYALEINRSIPDYPSVPVVTSSKTGRLIVEHFMAVSVEDLIMNKVRSPEALAADYVCMQEAIYALALAHDKLPMDGTTYFMNLDSHYVEIRGLSLRNAQAGVPAQESDLSSLVRRDQITMNLYQYGPMIVTQPIVSLIAYEATSENKAIVSASELIWNEAIHQMHERALDSEEAGHMIDMFDTLCRLPQEYVLVHEFPATFQDLQMQASLQTFEIFGLPVAPVDLAPLHLQE